MQFQTVPTPQKRSGKGQCGLGRHAAQACGGAPGAHLGVRRGPHVPRVGERSDVGGVKSLALPRALENLKCWARNLQGGGS